MQIRVSLHNSGGELDFGIIEPSEDSADTSHDIIEKITEWELSPGDTIKIEEVQSSCRR